MNWKQRAETYRLQQLRAHQLGESPPVPERRPKRVASAGSSYGRVPFIAGGFRIWFIPCPRQKLYEEAILGH